MSCQHSLVYTRSFLKDVLKAISYKLDQGHSDAPVFYQDMCAKIEHLRDHPEIGSKPAHFPVFCARGYRFLPYGSFNIFYAVRGKTVVCMRLRHTSRQPI
ncbi:MAG: hypothetical protein A2268_01695 [Candidatus Raymondbacteria bacterium RifOxyA12_full_50_37]|uniref:Plasmid stabilization protein n=1 Tax=Candidatus Raymondbacteria bacterium RIFOXYD12_FULL_49_13 TaxID=1817890 RepID=A0A1F7F9Z9_UNCRA|nr:MAG: hypothetical protein A2268_01695 [Candidatus Raymondbacteria bacterium RifOxyA12_full_50_37]OGJ87779.1 MAG: hypothetical protein A2248_07300 [Candidatus Raymondbacteria bacterium RIFOXYA2_FULL_49_16]OGJ92486.1 MAG: hypothetical protein A2350_02960 [Candidatus Raymondbacteria bacterium RifOxyB12_full_50_8]OGJ95657.1 MAG: hypothetical protein A2453_13295 [Candidatus Raymondbacteria bacterium RIFOXYC2_FULL_50_21]OGK03428.1 MAG: hypothetical protein A2519_15575 [Candidatus Raymondbacteria b